MGKKRWLSAVCICLMLSGCGGSAAESEVQAADTAMAVCETAAFPEEEMGEAEVTVASSANSQPRANAYVYEGNKDNLSTDGLTYFTFTEKNITHTNDAGETLLQEILTQTSFYSDCKIQNEWVNSILSDLQTADSNYGKVLLEYARQDKKESKDNFYFHSHYVSRGIARHDEGVISILSLASVYSGGTYPYMTQTAYNLDMKELKSLALEDVVQYDGCTALYDLILQKVEEKFSSFGESGLHDNYRKIISDAVTYGKMTPYWYFNDSGLVIFFNQYELASNAAGIIKIELEYGALEGILKESYFPGETEGSITSVSIEQNISDNRSVYDVYLGAGETVYLTLKGKASQVQLSEVSFVEQTAVSSTMLFSANQLDEEITLAVTFAPDPELIYAVEYYDGSGGPNVLYFKENKLVTDLQ